MKIIEIKGSQARCQAAGVERDVDIFLLQNEPLKPGDFVMVHVGYAIQKVAVDEALSSWALHHEMTNSHMTNSEITNSGDDKRA